jgi:hypothetical protein
MRQRAKPLTAIAVANARCPRNQPRIEIPDGGCRGLYLVVQNSGAKSWACRYRPRRSRKSRKLTLGDVFLGEGEPTTEPAKDTPLTLAAARLLAATALLQVQAGRDPAAEKRAKREAENAAEADTLEAVAEEFLRREFAKKRTFNQRKADLSLLYKPLGALRIEQITRGEFARAFDRIADERGDLRRDRVLGAAKRLLTWHASRSDYRPVLGRESTRLVSIREGARSRILSEDELRKVWLAAEQAGTFGSYVRFLLLTATRRKEASAMQRGELEDSATWIIPWERYKTGDKSRTDMLIPLSKAAQEIVAAQPNRGEYIFSSTGERPLTNFAVNKARFDAACGVTGWTIHDLRRTSRTLLSKVTTPDIAERCLGHVLMGQRGTYDRYSYQDEKRAAFEALAALIERIVHPPEVADFAKERGKRRR